MMKSLDFRGAWLTPLLTLLAAMVAGILYLGVSAMPAMADSVSVDTSPGTNPPPPTLGPFDMMPFEADDRAELDDVTDVPAPGGGVLQFDHLLSHRKVGSTWLTWSHGYSGDVYADRRGTQVVMTLPENTKAFYFYVEPNDFATYNVTATASDGTTSGPIPVEGFSGAKYFGFYTTDGSSLSTIQVDVDIGAIGYAVGEFGIAYGPTTTDDCKNGGYEKYGFKNQGDCVSYVATHGKNEPGQNVPNTK
jgi:hypothetical protein